ncbi:methyl-accepting chemotaxis protein [Aquibacillus sediminis]|uniref:methyl-accepting chemotaxis protein n=1 Tax=Aquibacillus sediminis TaxID=2574734 RepID=UPI001FE3306D|nr:HAMP domain-containing methyl-accepting chemotaxis protein [Aquibacillus sediminis]
MFLKRKWNNTTIGGKYGMIFSFMAVIFFASILLTYFLLNKTNDTMDESMTTNEIAIDSSELVSYFNEKYIQIPDYLVVENEEKLASYIHSSRQFVSTAKSLKQKLENEEQVHLFNQIIENNNELDQYFFSTIVPNVKQINTEQFADLQASANDLKEQTKQLGEELKVSATESNQVALNNAQSNITNTIWILLIAGILSIVLSFLLLVFVSRKINKSLHNIVDTSNKIAHGDLQVDKLTNNGKDEIGQLSQSINYMGDSLRNMINEISDLSSELDQQSYIVSNATNEVKTGSHQVASTIEQLATGTSNQANEAATISESTKAFEQKVIEATKHSEELVNFSNIVENVTEDGNKQMQKSLTQMNLISEAVETSVNNVTNLTEKTNSITEIVSVIKSIAEQTNLLALNASIEAARAGESGKGFAVVADEVRKLAEEVSNSIENITEIVYSIKEETSTMSQTLKAGYDEVTKGANEIQLTDQVFADLKAKVGDMSERINQIASTFEYINQSSQDINQSVEHIAAISEQSAAGTEEITASIQEQSSAIDNISTSTQTMTKMVDNMNNLMKKFQV